VSFLLYFRSMTQVAERVLPSIGKPREIPPLENGDQLSRDEFERRWDAMPNLKKAELIEGTVYMPPALSHDFHSQPRFRLIGALALYMVATPGVDGGDNGSVRLDFKNMPQPDIYLLILPKHGGQAKIDADHFIAGAPEFIAEVANTSASYDLHQKLEVYRRNGVREYIVWRTMDAEFDFMVLKDGRYQITPAVDGIIRSSVFPGLWLNTDAALRDDWVAVFQTMQAGIASPEHVAFVEQLKSIAQSPPVEQHSITPNRF
jgi:Uma2 family endonuclease